MANDSENGAVCKDGARSDNARLIELLSELDKLGFRINKLETNGSDFELAVRDVSDRRN